jgi:hypothetical protein
MSIKYLKVQVGAETREYKGRVAWALNELLVAGESGCTPIDNPAPRWSDAVFKLRRDGIDVETVTEKHGGPYAGHHARYLLRSLVAVLEAKEAA